MGVKFRRSQCGGGERRLRVFDDRVFRRVFGPKRDELRGE